MKKTSLLKCGQWVMLAAMGLSVHAFAQPVADAPGRAVLKVNGSSVGLDEMEALLIDRLRAGARDTPALREEIRRELVVRALLLEQAEKEQIEKLPAVQSRLRAARASLLAQAWQEQWIRAHPPTEEEIQQEYQQLVARTGDKEYQVRQVVVRDETAARLILDQIRRGGSLSELAKAYSIDPVGKDEGGILPWVTPGQLVAPLDTLVPKAKQSEIYPQAVRSANGWHVFEVLAHRPFAMPVLDQMRPQIIQALVQRKLNQRIQAMIDSARIESN